jgi:hypothetical protein
VTKESGWVQRAEQQNLVPRIGTITKAARTPTHFHEETIALREA